jgi:hypothetical protein
MLLKKLVQSIFEIRIRMEIAFRALLDRGRNRRVIRQALSGIDRLFIFGNGPSLRELTDFQKRRIRGSAALMVNHACQGTLFREMQPRFYLFVDPNFFSNGLRDPPTIKMVNDTYDHLSNHCDWPLILFVPRKYADLVARRIGKNCAVKIAPVSIDPLSQPLRPTVMETHGSSLLKRLTKIEVVAATKGIISLGAMNVINVAVWLAIVAAVPSIVVLGVDSNWHSQVRLQRNPTRIVLYDEHDYGTVERVLYRNSETLELQSLAGFFSSVTTAFATYELLSIGAIVVGSKVFIGHSGSWIDAFPLFDWEDPP